MSPALAITAIVVLAALLAVVSAVAGALWWRVRSLPLIEAVRLARALTARRRALEALLERVASVEGSSVPVGAGDAAFRVDGARTLAAGPRLIAVPDLSASPSPASAELAGRYAAVLDMADAGASAEAIAHATNQPVGQVELILGLRRRLAPPGAPEGRP
jgi:hypothetical protein